MQASTARELAQTVAVVACRTKREFGYNIEFQANQRRSSTHGRPDYPEHVLKLFFVVVVVVVFLLLLFFLGGGGEGVAGLILPVPQVFEGSRAL